MSRSSCGKNRVCFPCRIKYPGKFTSNSKNFNITDVCSECGGELTEIHDSICVPKKHQKRAWRKFEEAIKSGTFKKPIHKNSAKSLQYKEDPRHMAIDNKIEHRLRRENAMSVASAMEAQFSGITEQLVQRLRKLKEFNFSIVEICKDIVDQREDMSEEDIFDPAWLRHGTERLQDRFYTFKWYILYVSNEFSEKEKKALYA